MSVLVDTSVWIDFLRRTPSERRPTVRQLLLAGRAAFVDPIIAELCYGARGKRERDTVTDLAATAVRLPLDLPLWTAAGELGQKWRTRGRTLSLVDCLLVAACQRHGTPLWSLDADFAPLAEAGELTLYEAAA